MKAEIISVGAELLTGTIVNTNTAFLARQLALMGFEMARQSVVGDVEDEIVEAVMTATRRSHVTILTGGLGPTQDDLTKESVAKAFGLGLEKNPAVERSIRRFFEERGRPMPENNLKQALTIQGSEVLENLNGTSPGVYLQTATQAIVLLPGPANELEPMFINEVKPRLEKLSHISSASASLHVFGIGESALEEQVQDLLYGQNPISALYAKLGEVHIELLARANSTAEAEAVLHQQIARIKDRVGDYIYSDDGSSLAETVVKELTESKTKLAIAESCTGGLMASRVTEVPGASRVFDYGISAYSDEIKQKGLNIDIGILRKFSAISSATAAEMAKGARQKGGADIGVGITGVAGPVSDFVNKPVGLVYIAVADKKQVVVKKFNFGSMTERTAIRELCVINALDMVRRFLLGLEISDARTFETAYLADLDNEGRPRKKSSIAAKRIASQCLMVLFILAGAALCINAVSSHSRRAIYNRLKAAYAKNNDLLSIKEENPDTVGWLQMEESSSIDSVVVNNPDDFYQTHDFSGAANALGCLYVDPGCDINQSDNIVIHGTSTDRTQMFGPLLSFTDPLKVSDGNALIRLDTLSDSTGYRVVSIFYANSNPEKGVVHDFFLEPTLAVESVFSEFVVQIKMRSVVNIEIDILSGDKFLTLVTDAPDWQGAKLVMVARAVRPDENVVTTPAMFSYNLSATYPSEWYLQHNRAPSSVEQVERERWLNWLMTNAQTRWNDDDGGIGSRNDSALIRYGSNGEVLITVYVNNRLISDTPLNIVSLVVSYEMMTSDDPEAIKAVAMAVTGTICQAYLNDEIPDLTAGDISEPIPAIKTLVEEVINRAVFYNGELAYTPYFKSCAGRTYNAADILGEAYAFPYLKSVDSIYETSYNMAGEYRYQYSFSSSALMTKIQSYLLSHGIEQALPADTSQWLSTDVVSGWSGDGSPVRYVTVAGGHVFNAYDFMSNCLGIEASNFSLQWDGDNLTITAYGHGHGVGLSKSGANFYAIRGWDYQTILRHYYPGVIIGSLNWATDIIPIT